MLSGRNFVQWVLSEFFTQLYLSGAMGKNPRFRADFGKVWVCRVRKWRCRRSLP